MKNKVDKKSLQGIGIIFIAAGAGTTIILNMIGGLGLLVLGIIFLISGLKK
jgi:hypothetical protein